MPSEVDLDPKNDDSQLSDSDQELDNLNLSPASSVGGWFVLRLLCLILFIF